MKFKTSILAILAIFALFTTSLTVQAQVPPPPGGVGGGVDPWATSASARTTAASKRDEAGPYYFNYCQNAVRFMWLKFEIAVELELCRAANLDAAQIREFQELIDEMQDNMDFQEEHIHLWYTNSLNSGDEALTSGDGLTVESEKIAMYRAAYNYFDRAVEWAWHMAYETDYILCYTETLKFDINHFRTGGGVINP